MAKKVNRDKKLNESNITQKLFYNSSDPRLQGYTDEELKLLKLMAKIYVDWIFRMADDKKELEKIKKNPIKVKKTRE